MKFTVAWSKIVSENSVLKAVVLCLCGLSMFFGITTLKLGLKDPIVIERGCYSKVSTPVGNKRTSVEIEAFLKEAISQRFDSNVLLHDDFLASDEQAVRQKEQKELSSRKLVQRVLINSFIVDGGNVSVDADRVISIGEIRSAFKFPLLVKMESVTRTQGNPYGLVVSEVKAIEKKEK